MVTLRPIRGANPLSAIVLNDDMKSSGAMCYGTPDADPPRAGCAIAGEAQTLGDQILGRIARRRFRGGPAPPSSQAAGQCGGAAPYPPRFARRFQHHGRVSAFSDRPAFWPQRQRLTARFASIVPGLALAGLLALAAA